MKRLLVIAVAVLAVAGVTWLVVAASGSSSSSAAAVSPAPRPTDTTWPLGVASPEPATVAPSASSTAPSPVAVQTGAAAPFVQAFANQSGVPAQPALPSPTTPHSVPANIDGCDHNYGTVTQCVPVTLPDGATDYCAWLKAHNFGTLKVVGKDDLKLDRDGDRIACD